MRCIDAAKITDTVAELCKKANYSIGRDVVEAISCFLEKEKSEIGKEILRQILDNCRLAEKEKLAMCQDTGMAVLFLEIGQDVVITGGSLVDAVNEGVRQGYAEGYLRKSVVDDPLFSRKNTQDNTPAVVYSDIVPGDRIKISFMPKGFGSENMSRIKMLKPADGVEGLKDFVLEVVEKAGSNPCPPIIVGIGVGGTMEKAALLSKKALLRPLNKKNEDPRYAQLEKELLESINRLGIGPQGLGGRTTALGVNIEHFPTHIAGLPVAVNICCHAMRHAEAII